MSRLRPITSSDPSSEEARLVRLVRPPPPMSPEQFARCSERVTALARAPRVTSNPWAPLAAVGTAVALVVAGGVFVAARTTDANVRNAPALVQTLPTATPEIRTNETIETVPSVSIDALPSAEPPVARGSKRAATTTSGAPSQSASVETTGREDMLSRELQLVDGARVELAQHPSRAYDLLVRHANQFPAGQLASEREVLLVDALIRLDRRGEAEARGRSLVTREPGSPYARRVEALLSTPAASSER